MGGRSAGIGLCLAGVWRNAIDDESMSDRIPTCFRGERLTNRRDLLASKGMDLPGFYADHEVVGVASIGQLIVRLFGIQQHDGHDDASVLKQPDGAVHRGFGYIFVFGLELILQRFGFKEAFGPHDRRKDFGSFGCVSKRQGFEVTPKDRTQRRQDGRDVRVWRQTVIMHVTGINHAQRV